MSDRSPVRGLRCRIIQKSKTQQPKITQKSRIQQSRITQKSEIQKPRITQKSGTKQPKITQKSGIQQSFICAELGWEQSGIGCSEVPGIGLRVGDVASQECWDGLLREINHFPSAASAEKREGIPGGQQEDEAFPSFGCAQGGLSPGDAEPVEGISAGNFAPAWPLSWDSVLGDTPGCAVADVSSLSPLPSWLEDPRLGWDRP